MWRPPKARSGPNLLLRSPLFGVLISHRKMLVSSLVSEDYPVSCVIIRKAIVVSRITAWLVDAPSRLRASSGPSRRVLEGCQPPGGGYSVLSPIAGGPGPWPPSMGCRVTRSGCWTRSQGAGGESGTGLRAQPAVICANGRNASGTTFLIESA
ncbi:hypothetical protein VTN96DRAFT_9569 [Rasamsonia emersonii]